MLVVNLPCGQIKLNMTKSEFDDAVVTILSNQLYSDGQKNAIKYQLNYKMMDAYESICEQNGHILYAGHSTHLGELDIVGIEECFTCVERNIKKCPAFITRAMLCM